jgi:hypothetical protein
MRRLLAIVVFLLILGISSLALAKEVSRPLKNQGPTEVQIQVFVVDIDSIDTAGQSFEANVYYTATWYDPRLKGLSKDKIRRPITEVWNPRIQLLNQQLIWRTFPETVAIYPSGIVSYRQRIWGSFSQPLELKNFPFDKQTFNIVFVSTDYDKNEVKLLTAKDLKSGIAPRFSVADWKITGWKLETRPDKIAPEKEPYIMSIEESRRVGYFILQMIAPLCLIVMMSWTVFWIDPNQSGVQIGVSTTTILTLIAYRFMVGIELPKFSYLTRLDFFILISTILVFSSLIEVIVTSWLARNNKITLARRIDVWARWLFPLIFVLCALNALIF